MKKKFKDIYSIDIDYDITNNNDNHSAINDIFSEDPDATPKLEKRHSMSQIFSNLKSKFGSTSSKKSGKSKKIQVSKQKERNPKHNDTLNQLGLIFLKFLSDYR